MRPACPTDNRDQSPRLTESGNRIDRLMTLEIRPVDKGLPCGVVVPIYEICRNFQGGTPLSLRAALGLNDHLRKGETVFIATGAGVPPNLPFGETDGPLGAIVLAVALVKAYGARIILVTEDAHAGPIRAVAQYMNAQMDAAPDVDYPNGKQPLGIESFPLGFVGADAVAAKLMSDYQPVVVMFVERDGPNLEGEFHGVRGDCRDPQRVGYVFLLAQCAREKGVLTIGIGDGGNEVGFGAMREQIRDVLPLRGRSLAGHPSGVVTAISTDITVSASVSNWGAYAIVAALAVVLRRKDILHDSATEHELTAIAVAAGARDGATSTQALVTDGIPLVGHKAFVDLLAVTALAAIE